MTKVSENLKVILADLQVFRSKVQNFHWHVRGPHFLSLHEFYEKIYREVQVHVDDVAERIVALGDIAPGTLHSFLNLTTLTEESRSDLTALEMNHALLSDIEKIVAGAERILKEADGDDVTIDMIIKIMSDYSLRQWMLRALVSE